MRAGDHAGAVAGWIGGDGRADYVYPEITGYFLQWLASMAQRHGAQPIAFRLVGLLAVAADALRGIGPSGGEHERGVEQQRPAQAGWK